MKFYPSLCRNLIFALSILAFMTACSDEDDIPDPVKQYEGYTLVWNDEFDESSISNLNWTYETGDGTDFGLPSGWGNNELQIYTMSSANAFIEEDANGISSLVISANKEADGSYTSAKLTTQGLQSFRYGRIEARMKPPTGQGMWPAFWMLGTNRSQVDWPGCGEIDIMELVGFEPDAIHGTLHYTNGEQKLTSNQGTVKLAGENFADNYHDFRVDWTPASITFSLDGNVYHTIALEDDMKEFQRSFYLILNVAVGGNWPGNPDASTNFPQSLFVDYVRVYSQDGFNPPAEPALDIEEESIFSITPAGIARHALNSALNQFPGVQLNIYGAGGEPEISATDMAIEGDSALIFDYPGGNWGGGWFEMEPGDLSAYSGGNLVFSIRQPGIIDNVEIKLEAVSNSAAVFLTDYAPASATQNFVTYTIPIADFAGVDLSNIIIPFSFWNPVDSGGNYPAVEVLIDNLYWEQ